jgi:hypothetical protein
MSEMEGAGGAPVRDRAHGRGRGVGGQAVPPGDRRRAINPWDGVLTVPGPTVAIPDGSAAWQRG